MHLRDGIIVINNFSEHGRAVGVTRRNHAVLENHVHELLTILVAIVFLQLWLSLAFGTVATLTAARFQFLCVVQARLRNLGALHLVCGRLGYIQNRTAVVQVFCCLAGGFAGWLVLHLGRAPTLESLDAAAVGGAGGGVVQARLEHSFDFLVVDIVVICFGVLVILLGQHPLVVHHLPLLFSELLWILVANVRGGHSVVSIESSIPGCSRCHACLPLTSKTDGGGQKLLILSLLGGVLDVVFVVSELLLAVLVVAVDVLELGFGSQLLLLVAAYHSACGVH